MTLFSSLIAFVAGALFNDWRWRRSLKRRAKVIEMEQMR